MTAHRMTLVRAAGVWRLTVGGGAHGAVVTYIGTLAGVLARVGR